MAKNEAGALIVEEWPIGKFRDYERNPRKNDHVIDQMVASIKEYGFRIPVVAKSDGLVVDGHLRLKAARKMGLKTLPAALADNLTDAQIKAFRLLANRSASWADWDDGLLKLELGELQGMGFDLALTGFSLDEIGGLTRQEGLTDPDEAPEPPADPVSELGDVWLLGSHRLVCGDSTTVESVDMALNGVKPHLMVTDPPYGVDYDASWRNVAAAAGLIGQKKSTRAVGKVENDDRADWSEAWALFPGDVAYIWHAGNKAHIVAESLLNVGFGIRAQIIWAKNQFVIGRGHYHPHHEPCWYAVRERQGATGHWSGDRKQSTLWQIDKPHKSETGHSTQKPVECMKRPIENNSRAGQAVYEPFSGSGTTLIAGEMTGRHIHAIELSPAYVDVGVTRWQNFTGKTATLEATGQTFAEVTAQRQQKANGARAERAPSNQSVTL